VTNDDQNINLITNLSRKVYVCTRKKDTNGDVVHGIIECAGIGEWDNPEEIVENPSNPDFWFSLGVSALLVLTAGLMSGLTLGFMGLDITTIEILKSSGSDKEKNYAKKLIPLLKKHHLLLVTLLLMNSMAMEALPIFLERLIPPAIAILVSVTLILMFGEVIPQALCNRYGLEIGATLYWFVWGLIVITFPITWPISILLDKLLGKEHRTIFRRAELKELVRLHGTESGNNDENEALSKDEISLIKEAIDLRNKSVISLMKPLKEVFMLSISAKMNANILHSILDSRLSRIPIYRGNREQIVGMLLVKTLLLFDPSDEVPISKLNLKRLPLVPAKMPLYTMLKIFQTGKSHMAVVIDQEDNSPLGIITLADIIETLLQKKIVEYDDEEETHKMEESEEIEDTLVYQDNSLSLEHLSEEENEKERLVQ